MDERQALAQLRAVLATLYDDQASIRRIVHDAGLDEAQVAFSARVQDSWHSILQEAKKRSRVEQIVQIAMREYPENRELLIEWAIYKNITQDEKTETISTSQRKAFDKRIIILALSLVLIILFLTFKLETILTFVIRLFFAISGVATLFYMLIGAFEWANSVGEREAIKEARAKITTAVVGMILLVGVLGIIYFLEQIVFNGRISFGISSPMHFP